jgi:hypothetical protein
MIDITSYVFMLDVILISIIQTTKQVIFVEKLIFILFKKIMLTYPLL